MRRSNLADQSARPGSLLGGEGFSYADPDDPALKRALIRLIETLTGQPKLHAMYLDYTADPARYPDFWQAAMHYLNLGIMVDQTRLNAIPKDGPLVIVSNHPFGVIDGLVAGHLISQVRRDFKILTHSLLCRAPEAKPFLLPVDFAETKEALATNLETRKAARAHLEAGGCLVIFPAGGVSTTPTPFARQAQDVEWKSFVTRMVHQGRADVVPMFFEGQNSRPFQIVSHMSQTVRLALFFHEVSRRIGTQVAVKIGERLPYSELSRIVDRHELTETLRKKTYDLAGT